MTTRLKLHSQAILLQMIYIFIKDFDKYFDLVSLFGKIQNLPIIRGWIPRQSGGNSSLWFYLASAHTVAQNPHEWNSILTKTTTKFIFGIRANTNLVYQYRTSLRLRNHNFAIRLDLELWIGTPLCQYLIFKCNVIRDWSFGLGSGITPHFWKGFPIMPKHIRSKQWCNA